MILCSSNYFTYIYTLMTLNSYRAIAVRRQVCSQRHSANFKDSFINYKSSACHPLRNSWNGQALCILGARGVYRLRLRADAILVSIRDKACEFVPLRSLWLKFRMPCNTYNYYSAMGGSAKIYLSSYFFVND